MYYYCVENQRLCSVLNYEPNAPASMSVHLVDDDVHARIQAGEWWFNVDKLCPEPVPSAIQDQRNEAKTQNDRRSYLSSTDWQVLRHIRQQALGIETSLTEAEYLHLEYQREQAAKSI
jgi:hypothetical protein